MLTSGKKSKEPTGDKLRELVTYIKNVGRIPIDCHNLLTKMQSVLKLLRKYPACIQIQRAGCHTVSNVAMDISPARLLMEQKAHKIIIRALSTFYKEDWRICWLGASALWNLARPEEYRDKLTTETVDLMLNILKTYAGNKKVVNTTIGALSNLVLDSRLKYHLGQQENLPILLEVTEKHLYDESIACTAAGMLANLAVDDNIGNSLIICGVVKTITNMMNLRIREATFQRNTAAVLSNCLTSPYFLSECLEHRTVEALFDLQNSAVNIGVIALVINCFQSLDVNPDQPTSSIHLCCKHNEITILKRLLHEYYNRAALNVVDSRGYTPIVYAAIANHIELVTYLIKCGADYEVLKNDELNIDEHIFQRIDECLVLIENTRYLYANTVDKSTKAEICSNVAGIVADFLSPYSMIENIDMDIENTLQS